MTEDFNRIKPWLTAKLKERGISTHTFARWMKTNSATIYRWYSDTFRPTPEMMKRVCECLSSVPIKAEDGSERYEVVLWEEGMAQYTPREIEGKERRIRALRQSQTFPKNKPEPDL